MKLAPIVVFTASLLHAQTAVVVFGGNWKLNDGRELGKELPAGTQVKGTSSYPLLLACGADWVVHKCKEGTCSEIACKPSDPKNVVKPWQWSKSTPDGFLQGLLKREPASAVTAGARDALDIRDSLVLYDGEAVHLAPALRRTLEGSYCFQLEALPKGKLPQRNFVLNWTKDPQGAVSLPSLPPGLYALDGVRLAAGSTCKIDQPSPSPTWVLVATSGQFESLKKEWDRISPNVASVEADSDPEIAAKFLQALMAALADSIQCTRNATAVSGSLKF
jgi:hypothetical protein